MNYFRPVVFLWLSSSSSRKQKKEMQKWYTQFSESILTELTDKIVKVLKVNKQAEGHILPYTIFC